MLVMIAGDKQYEGSDEFTLLDEFPIWSPDGSIVAFRVISMGKQYLVAGDKKSEAFDNVFPPIIFSPDGTKIAFGVRKSYQDTKTSDFIYEFWWKVMEVR